MDGQQQLPGLDLDRFGSRLRTTVPGVTGDLHASLITGGKSNLTYVVTDGRHEWVVTSAQQVTRCWTPA